MLTDDPIQRRVTRCAIYTRKSTERGLDLPVNSLESQREVCGSYIKCQAHRNWIELPRRYDDGGYSGGTLARPALNELIKDVEEGRIDVIVIYKIDRLTRSLLDFVRLIDVLQKYGVSFVSVTQAFDTSDSMGRLVLNVLLTFAQFERELMSDRVRDKKAAMIKRGLFTGGIPPFGYLVKAGGKLEVDRDRAPILQEMFEQYPLTSSVRELVQSLNRRGLRTRRWTTRNGRETGGNPITAGMVRQILLNPIYTGSIVHRGEWIKAEVEPLVTREQWDLVQQVRSARRPTRNPDRDFLLGILHDEHGRKMGMAETAPGYGCRPRYYRGQTRELPRKGQAATFADSEDVERVAIASLQAFLRNSKALNEAVMALGRYSEETARLLKNGKAAAGRLERMNAAAVRRLFVALIPRAEVSAKELRLYISCFELTRYLAWDGEGVFCRAPRDLTTANDQVKVITAPAQSLCGRRFYRIPISPKARASALPKPWLVDVLRKAQELREFVLANRDLPLVKLAKQKRMGPTKLSQYVRASYLAPDIQAAILNGEEPPELTVHDLLSRPIPMDWEQQRQLLGFRNPT